MVDKCVQRGDGGALTSQLGWVHADSFLHGVASLFHSFVTPTQLPTLSVLICKRNCEQLTCCIRMILDNSG